MKKFLAVCLSAARFRSGRHALLLVGGEFLRRGGLRPPAQRECDPAGGQGGGEPAGQEPEALCRRQ